MPLSTFQVAIECWFAGWMIYCVVHLVRVFRFFHFRIPTRKEFQAFAGNESSPWSPFSKRGKMFARLYAFGGIAVLILDSLLAGFVPLAHPN
jgi:hypothetical protein